MWIKGEVAENEYACEAPFSLYHDLVRPYWKSREQSPLVLHRLCTLARKMRVKSILIGPAFDDPSVAGELDSYCGRWAKFESVASYDQGIRRSSPILGVRLSESATLQDQVQSRHHGRERSRRDMTSCLGLT